MINIQVQENIQSIVVTVNCDQVNIQVTETVQQVNVTVGDAAPIIAGVDWTNYALQYRPSTQTTITGGIVIQYESDTETVYRFVPNPYDYDADAFYSGFDGTNLTGLLATRK